MENRSVENFVTTWIARVNVSFTTAVETQFRYILKFTYLTVPSSLFRTYKKLVLIK